MIVEAISGLIDEIALEKPLDWESFNYEATKQVAIMGAIEQYHNINNSTLSDEEKRTSLLAVLAYLVMENTQLWIEMYKMKESK